MSEKTEKEQMKETLKTMPWITETDYTEYEAKCFNEVHAMSDMPTTKKSEVPEEKVSIYFRVLANGEDPEVNECFVTAGLILMSMMSIPNSCVMCKDFGKLGGHLIQFKKDLAINSGKGNRTMH